MMHVGLLYVSLYTIATQLAFGKTNYALENIWSSYYCVCLEAVLIGMMAFSLFFPAIELYKTKFSIRQSYTLIFTQKKKKNAEEKKIKGCPSSATDTTSEWPIFSLWNHGDRHQQRSMTHLYYRK